MLKQVFLAAFFCVGIGFLSGGAVFAAEGYVKLDPAKFQTEVDGKKVGLYTITNKSGMSVSITNYGGRVEQILAPDRNGKLGDVALGYDSIEKILKAPNYIGVFVGRLANRINKGQFTLDGQKYQITLNNGPHSLHGGVKGSRAVVFDAKQLSPSSVQMSYVFKDGEEGFPGTLPMRVIFSLTDNNEFMLRYEGVAVDKATVAAFTCHAFFNLSGDLGSTILDHQVRINADKYTPVDAALIPTGEELPVAGTPMDFRKFKAIGQDIRKDNEMLKLGKGYDLNFVINGWEPHKIIKQATVVDPKSGRKMEVLSDEPGLQFFSGNFFAGQPPFGKGEVPIALNSGFAMEPQRFPDTVNQPKWPSVALKPGEWYSGTIIYKFSVEKGKKK